MHATQRVGEGFDAWYNNKNDVHQCPRMMLGNMGLVLMSKKICDIFDLQLCNDAHTKLSCYGPFPGRQLRQAHAGEDEVMGMFC